MASTAIIETINAQAGSGSVPRGVFERLLLTLGFLDGEGGEAE